LASALPMLMARRTATDMPLRRPRLAAITTNGVTGCPQRATRLRLDLPLLRIPVPAISSPLMTGA
jgi:hypothetical protein